MADRAVVRTAHKYFVLDFHQFPFKVFIFRMSHDYCSFRIFVFASEVNLLNTDFDYTWIYGENKNKINTVVKEAEKIIKLRERLLEESQK